MAKQHVEGEIQCFLCLDWLEIKETFKGKPYLICDRDGVQIFFRGKAGIARLSAMVNNGGGENETGSTGTKGKN